LNSASKERDLILMTKVFPFGHQEQYLLNELPFLIKSFRKVIIVPYDEFIYKAEENRLQDSPAIIFKINNETKSVVFSLKQKLKRELVSWRIFIFEVIYGREKINHLRFLKRNLSQLRHSYAAATSLSKYIKDSGFNKVIFYNYWMHGGVIISNICNLLLGKNHLIISRAHAYDVYHKDWYTIFPNSKYIFLGFESWKVHHCEKIFTISKHGYNHFMSLFPKLKTKFSLSRLGVTSTGKIKSLEKDDQILIVSCSNIDGNKRVYRIPELISLLNKPVRWMHFGKGNEDETLKVTAEINKYNLQNFCELRGFIPNEEVRRFYDENEVDLFINLSQIEGIPVSLMEVASYGTPMLATNTVGNPEIVNNENGFLIDVDFVTKDIAEKINSFFENNEAVKFKREKSYSTFLEKYDASKNYPEFINNILEFATTRK